MGSGTVTSELGPVGRAGSAERDLARRVTGLTAGLVLLIALGAWSFSGLEQAVGALAGGAITIANFLGLRWVAGLAVRGLGSEGRRLRSLLWLGATGGRLGLIALALGVAAAQGWIGLGGLLASLAALPATVVAEGLRAARLS